MRRKLGRRDVIAIRRRARAGEYLSVMAREHDISRVALLHVVRGATYPEVPGALPDFRGRRYAGPFRRGDQIHNAKLTEADVRRARRMARRCHDSSELAMVFGVRPQSIAKAIRGETWAHVPGALPDWEASGIGELHPNARLDNRDIWRMRAMVAAGWPQWHVARRYGIDIAHISRIVGRKTWSHLGDPPRPIRVPSPPSRRTSDRPRRPASPG
jgi:hypothetical protein